MTAPGAYDQRENTAIFGCKTNLPLAARHDVLVFATPPLTQSVEVTGFAEVRLWGASSAPDTDFTAKLIDAHPPNEDYPEGYAMNLVDSIIRARYRKSFERPELMKRGEVYEFTIRLPAVSNLFTAGHQIRLDISSSNFPTFDVNPNTGGSPSVGGMRIIAENSIYHDAEHPSRLILPVVPT
jgi:putative CocE/NonD family hydrolase